MKTVLQLIKEQCANFDVEMNHVRNHCCASESNNYQCGYYKNNKEDEVSKNNNDKFRCGYFEKSVLPLDKQLEAVYYAQEVAKQEGGELSLKEKKEIIKANKITLTCNICKQEFASNSKRKSKKEKVICKKCKKKNNNFK